MRIFLIGYRCTGKTTVGEILASMLDYDFLDIDEKVESDNGCSISSIVKTHGWNKFRKLEKQTLFETLDNEDIIVSTGGGIVLDLENRIFLKNNGVSIWLFANKDVIINRLTNDNNTLLSRPGLTDKKLEQETEMMIKQREPFYSEITQIKFDTSIKTPEKLAQMIKRRISNDRE